MSIIRWTPQWDPFSEMEEVMNRFPSINSQSIKSFVPAMDVYETEKSVVVETALPGINPDDVKVSVEKGVLTVTGESKKEHEVDDKNYYRKEVRSGSFFRQVALPAAVMEDKVNAVFEDGLLKISCPKSEPVKAKKVEIKVVKKNKK